MDILRRSTRVTAVIIALLVILAGITCIEANAASKGSISKVDNTSSGIKVSWSKDSTKTGYIVYKKTGSGSWKQAKKIASKNTLSWTDKSVSNGKLYTYKVYTYKGKKVTKNSTTKKTYRLTGPAIAVSSAQPGEITVTAGKNTAVSGYKVSYATKSSMSGAKEIWVADSTALKKTIGNLTPAKKYYVKAVAYKTVKGTKYYSAYSSVKAVTCKASCDEYINVPEIQARTAMNSSASYGQLIYGDKVKVVKNASATSKGNYYQVEYNGATYYIWQALGQNVFASTQFSLDFDDGTLSDYRSAVVAEALYWYEHRAETEYVTDDASQSKGELNANGKYGFDCSGLVSYILFKALREDIPVYNFTRNANLMYSPQTIYNAGYDQAFTTEILCDGTWNEEAVQPGDIVCFSEKNKNKPGVCTHVGIYLGDNKFIHSMSNNMKGKLFNSYSGVTISPMEGRYKEEFMRAMKFIPDSAEPINQTGTTSGKVNIYADMECASGTAVDTISSGGTYTLLYINSKVAYVKYGDDEKGFVLLSIDRTDLFGEQ